MQVPDRHRGAMLEVRQKSLEVLMAARRAGDSTAEWKCFLLTDLLLLYKVEGAGTCAEQLEERLAWFWGGQWTAMWAAVSGGKRASPSRRVAFACHRWLVQMDLAPGATARS